MREWQPGAVPRRNEDAVWREVDDEVFVCSPEGDLMFTLRDVSADIWRAIDGTNTVTEIRDLLLAAYEVDSETVTRDLAECLEYLASKRLIFGLDD